MIESSDLPLIDKDGCSGLPSSIPESGGSFAARVAWKNDLFGEVHTQFHFSWGGLSSRFPNEIGFLAEYIYPGQAFWAPESGDLLVAWASEDPDQPYHGVAHLSHAAHVRVATDVLDTRWWCRLLLHIDQAMWGAMSDGSERVVYWQLGTEAVEMDRFGSEPL